MINSKLEKFLSVLVLYALLVTCRFVLPVSEPPTNTESNVAILLSIITTAIILRVYTHYRDKNALKKIVLLLETNDLDGAEKYVNKCLKNQKNGLSAHLYKLYVSVMCGRIKEFEELLLKCGQSNRYKKMLASLFVRELIVIVDYIKSPNGKISDPDLTQTTKALSMQNEEDLPYLLDIYGKIKYSLFKALFAVKIYLIYAKCGNVEKAEQYYELAIKHAPSSEISYYIENLKNIKQKGDNDI